MPKPKSTSHQGLQESTDGYQLDPIIEGLLAHLPAPGEVWSPDRRELWLKTLALALELAYDEVDENAPQQTPDNPPGDISEV